jgi:hypothetical protein
LGLGVKFILTKHPCFVDVTVLEGHTKVRIRHVTSRQKIGIIALVLVVFISSEVYAHNYIKVRALPVLTKEQALKQLEVYVWWNGTHEFSSSGCSWLAVWRIPRPQPSANWAYFFIFKTEQNSSLWILRTDLAVLQPSPRSNSTGGYFTTFSIEVDYGDNCTTISVPFDVGWIGTYEVDFDIRVQVYQETLLGLLPKEVINVPTNVTMYYGP